MITINFANKIGMDIEKIMSDDLSDYEKSFGIDVNYEKFSLTISEEEQTIGVLNAFTAYAEIYIEDLWVDKRHRGKGYGRQLIESLIKKFEGSGFNNINLCTSRFQAPGFYEKCGFKLEFIRENHQNPELSKLFFVRFFNNKNQCQGKYSINATCGSHLSLSPEVLSNKNTESTIYSIQATSDPNPNDVQWLCDGIMGNAQYIKGHSPVEFFGFFLRDDQGSLHGGLNGDILYGGMYISQLFIEDSLRSQGYGSKLMQKAEALAKEKNCNFVSVNTMDFEALEFYKKHGFYIEFSRNGYDKNSVFHFLRKNITALDSINVTDQKIQIAGNLVRRKPSPGTASVHDLLKYLEKQGFSGGPHVLGEGYDEQGYELISYVPGNIIHPQIYTVEAMVALGELLRQFHQISSRYIPHTKSHWNNWFCRNIGTPDIIGHGDIAPWNIVTNNGLPTALIDWEYAGPIDRITELAYAAWTCAQLYDDDLADRNSLPDAKTRMILVRNLVDAYGLSSNERKIFADRIVEVAIAGASAEIIDQNIMIDSKEANNLWAIAWRTRSAAWMMRNKDIIHYMLA